MDHPVTLLEKLIPVVNHHNVHVAGAAVVFLLLGLAAVLVFPKIKVATDNVIPESKISLKNILEIFMQMWVNICEDVIGKDGRKYFPFICAMFCFIFVSNLMGLVPGFLPPTDSWVTGFSVAMISFIAFNYFGFKEHGAKYLKHFLADVAPGSTKNIFVFIAVLVPWLLFQALFSSVEVISMVLRPVVLTVRLTVNIFADHQVVGAFSNLVPYLIPIPFLLLGIFVAFMQAFIFSILTAVYISGAVAHDH